MTARWWTGSAAGFDEETDGIDVEDTRIITAGVVLTRNGETSAVSWLLQPERGIPAECTAIHGVTTEHAREHGMSRDFAFAQLAITLADANEETPLVGHNLAFDLTILDRELRRMKMGSLGLSDGLVSLRLDGRQITRFPVIDTYVIDRAVDKYRPGRRKLEPTATHYGVPMAEGSAHEVEADIRASMRVAWRIATMAAWPLERLTAFYAGRRKPTEVAQTVAGIRDMTLAELHASQVLWMAEQANGLRLHFTKNPDKGDAGTVSGAWPFAPFI